MLIQSLRPQTFSQVVGNRLNNKILMTLAKNPDKGPSTIILQGSFGSGKALDVNSMIPTPSGLKRAGDIQIGDFLFDRTGQPTRVTGVFPQGLLDSYKVTFEDGRVVYCNSEHLWTIIDRKTGAFNTLSLQNIIDRNIEVEIPVNQPVQYSSKQYTIPPYVLGLLLTESEVDKTTVLYSGKYLDILKSQMPNIEWEYNLIWSYSIPKDSQGNIISKEAFYGDILTDVENSIIPEIYLQGSIPQRWDILHGIMDVRGTVSNDNNVFCEIEQSMRESFQRLVNSLGLVVSIIEGVNKDVFYFKANRKTIKKLFNTRQIEDRPYNSHIDTTKIAITAIEKEEEQREMVCFLVDNPDHLFLCNDFIVTHNTTSSRLFAKALNCKHLKENDICGECDTCKADLNNVPWYTEFDSSAMGNVDSIRELRDIFITTARGYNRVIVLDETHLLSKTAQSALLKVFEETPRGIYFILATTDPDKLLPTIRSRSLELIYTAKSSKEVKEDIDKHAKELGLSLSSTTLDVIATRSRGIMRNAHMLLDKVNLIGEEEFLKSDLPTTSLLNNFIVAILKTDRVSVLDTVSELSRIPVSYLKDDWQEYFLNLMRASIDPDLVQDDRIKKIASALGKQTVNIVKFCIQDWVIKSFQNSTQAQTAMLAIYQSLSKEQK